MKHVSTRIALFTWSWVAIAFPVFADESFCEHGFTYTILEDSHSLSLKYYQAVPAHDYSLPLHIPASVVYEDKTYLVKRIDPRAFKGVTEIQSIVIDEGIEYIGKEAFDCCVNLKSIHIPASVEGVGEGLFGSCYELASVVVDTGNECLDSREKSNAIIDSDTDELLAACASTEISSSVKSIGDFAFYHCNTIERLVVPEGVETIGHHAFYGCGNLKNIHLPESLTAIGGDAFFC